MTEKSYNFHTVYYEIVLMALVSVDEFSHCAHHSGAEENFLLSLALTKALVKILFGLVY